MANTSDRVARLDALQASAVELADKRIEAYTDLAARCRSMLRGRTGAERLSAAMTGAVEEATLAEINAFITS